MAETRFELDFPVTRADHLRITRRVLRPQALRLFGVFAVVALATLGVTWVLFGPLPGGPWWVPGVLLFAAAVALTIQEAVLLRLRVTMRRHPERYPEGRHHVIAHEEAILLEAPGMSSRTRWTRVRRVHVTRRDILLWLTRVSAFHVPRSAFASRDAEQRFVRAAREWARQELPEQPDEEPPSVVRNPEALHLTFRNAVDDYAAFARYNRWERRTWHTWMLAAVGAALFVAVGCLGMTSALTNSLAELGPTVALTAAMAVVLLSAPLWGPWLGETLGRWQVRRDPERWSLEDKELHLGPDGLYGRTRQGEGSFPWTAVSEVIGHRDRTFLMLGEHHGIIVPDRIFDDPAEADAFRAQARAWHRAALGGARHDEGREVEALRGDNPFEAPGG